MKPKCCNRWETKCWKIDTFQQSDKLEQLQLMTMPVLQETDYIEKTEWNGVEFVVVDTGGLEPRNNEFMMTKIKEQAEVAMNMKLVSFCGLMESQG